MDFALSEEQEEVRNLARKIIGDLVTNDRLKEIEASEEVFDRAVWRELAAADLLGVGIDEEFGGSGMGFFTLCLLLEEVGRSVAPIPAVASLVLGALPIQRFGSDEQKRRYLPAIVAGETVLSAGLQEAGNDELARPTATARRDGEGWRLEGTKILVPAAHVAERILVSTKTADGEIGFFLVDPAAAGATLERQHTTDHQPHHRLVLDGARVEADGVLGDPARGAELARWLDERAMTAYCAVQVGVSERALQLTAEYTSSRIQFDRPVGSFQAVHMRAGDAFIDVQAMRLTTWEAAWRLADELAAADQVAVAKFWAADGGQRVGYAAQHLHGGIGVDVDYPIHRYYLWAGQIGLHLGTGTAQLAALGERIANPA